MNSINRRFKKFRIERRLTAGYFFPPLTLIMSRPIGRPTKLSGQKITQRGVLTKLIIAVTCSPICSG
jgi:hypothetical protein